MRTTLMAATAAWIACLGLANRALADTLTPYKSGSGEYTNFGTVQESPSFDIGSYPNMTSTVDPNFDGIRTTTDVNYVNKGQLGRRPRWQRSRGRHCHDGLANPGSAGDLGRSDVSSSASGLGLRTC